ncbi:MAG: hypothetical protein GY854_15150 [Deltaproteobacteria bacterium]|nr:hypothetical protein [Deltaproteobacteria bacterium]
MFFMAVNQLKRDADSNTVGKIIPPHIEWVENLIDDGVIVQAGKWGERSGMVVVRAADSEQAHSIIQKDPLVASGQFDIEIAQFFPNVSIAKYE